MSKRDKDTRKKNVEVVLNALKLLQCARLNDIVNYIAASHQVDPEGVIEPVKIILHKDIKCGYAQKRGPKYSKDRSISSGESDIKMENSSYRRSKPQKKRKRLS